MLPAVSPLGFMLNLHDVMKINLHVIDVVRGVHQI